MTGDRALFKIMISYNVLCVDERFAAPPFDSAVHRMPEVRDVWSDEICPRRCDTSSTEEGRECISHPQLELMYAMGICKMPSRSSQRPENSAGT